MIYLLSIKEQIQIWNDQLNVFTEQFDSPWAGMAIFLALFVVAALAINAFASKNK